MVGSHSQDQMAAANFMGSVFKDVGLQDSIVSDCDTRFVAELWTALHETLGTSLVFGTPTQPPK